MKDHSPVSSRRVRGISHTDPIRSSRLADAESSKNWHRPDDGIKDIACENKCGLSALRQRLPSRKCLLRCDVGADGVDVQIRCELFRWDGERRAFLWRGRQCRSVVDDYSGRRFEFGFHCIEDCWDSIWL